MGDSLSAAYGLRPEQGWVALADAKSARYAFHNASISGETSAGGRSRIDAELARVQPDIVIIELGANDGLRGLPPKLLAENLDAMISAARGASAQVLLISMQMPPNYGPVYTRLFAQTYATVAKARKVPLVPFLLEGFADQPELFLNDGIHPTADAQHRVLDTIWHGLKPLLGKH